MNSELNNFFKEERKRVFEPGPYFTQRVMARVGSQATAPAAGIWDIIPGSVSSVLALALVLLFAVLVVQIVVPVEPPRGPIEAYVGQDLTPSERLLFSDPQAPAAGAAQFEALMVLEPEQ